MSIGAWVIAGLAGLAALTLAAALLYWQLVIAEGAYLGRRVVTWLYDWYAPRYDRVKQFRPASDAVMLARPILRHLAACPAPSGTPVVLDVATGTGRLPGALLAQPRFGGRIVALDLSARMLALAQAKLSAYADRITWMAQDAQQLPFDDHTFDVVSCLESIEFFPQPQAAVREMARVLRPGGLLIVSNRIGPDAWKLPGRATSTPHFAAWLGAIGFVDVQPERWLVDYDLITAIKQVNTL